uniref:Uncharacterized protein n=1 Tax=Zea mays TaxID=4577 RepID=A0A804PDT2_MAIZE
MGHALAEPRPPRRLAGTPLEPPIARAARSGPATLPPPPSSGNLWQRAVTPGSKRRVASHSTRAARPPAQLPQALNSAQLDEAGTGTAVGRCTGWTDPFTSGVVGVSGGARLRGGRGLDLSAVVGSREDKF